MGTVYRGKPFLRVGAKLRRVLGGQPWPPSANTFNLSGQPKRVAPRLDNHRSHGKRLPDNEAGARRPGSGQF